MYTGFADHTLTAELVRAGRRPGDRLGRHHRAASAAEQVLARHRRAAVMIGRGAQGNPWLAARAGRRGRRRAAEHDEVVAELVRFIREVVREIGEERSVGFLRKFYGWYLRGGRIPRPMRPSSPRRRRSPTPRRAAARGARRRGADPGPRARARASSGTSRTTRLLELPISIYGGGDVVGGGQALPQRPLPNAAHVTRDAGKAGISTGEGHPSPKPPPSACRCRAHPGAASRMTST